METWYDKITGAKTESHQLNPVMPDNCQREKPDIFIKNEVIKDAKKVFAGEVKKGFEYKDHIFQCDEIDQVRWTKGVKLMERHGFETANAVDINNDEWLMTLIEMAEIRDKAEDTWFTLWFTYQGVKNT